MRLRARDAVLGLALVLAWSTAWADDSYGDLEGFGEEDDSFTDVTVEETPMPQRWWDVDGSVTVSSSINYLSHRAQNPPLFTDWTGLSRLRARLDLELDVDLPYEFDLRLSPYVWYDFAYLVNGFDEFTDAVRDEYEWEWDFQESYLEGSLLESLDLKIGRQVVVWGHSDSLRVVDVLNPLDNRIPGRADIADLRWAVGMAKLDWYVDRYDLTAIAIPEIRFETLPVFGHDFFPLPMPAPPEHIPDSFGNWEFAAALSGNFEGWDASLHYAWIYADLPRLSLTARGVEQVHDRIHMVGAAGNYAWGSWLLKTEGAWLQGLRYAVLDPLGPAAGLRVSDEKSRFDALVGVEYYGFDDSSIALDVANRHVFDYERAMRNFPTALREDSAEYALRYTADWLDARLRTTVLVLGFGWAVQDGAVIRAQGDYTVRDGLMLTIGALLFEAGNLPPLDAWGRNDRIFVDLRWSF